MTAAHSKIAPPVASSLSPPAQRLRAARLAKNLSQVDLAVRAGVSVASVGWYERGGKITPVAATKLCDALDLSPEELLR